MPAVPDSIQRAISCGGGEDGEGSDDDDSDYVACVVDVGGGGSSGPSRLRSCSSVLASQTVRAFFPLSTDTVQNKANSFNTLIKQKCITETMRTNSVLLLFCIPVFQGSRETYPIDM